MYYKIEFATNNDLDELQSLFLEYGMGLAGDIEEHILLKRDNDLLAGALLTSISDSVFHLSVLAVSHEGRSQGLGTQFMQELLRHPQKYCCDPGELVHGTFQVTTVARGTAINFYKKNGFVPSSFSKLVSPYNMQCNTCEEKEECNPVPMVFYSHPHMSYCSNFN
ncbi:GNAT family N-acetyltransferase [Sporomusa malonica]|uniref:N-acetylglutamate synthase, GNAT family n=1 Tax=Sporomusa malonica TaxID=112901 RepID=A0A1W1YNS4_9FIRM|nr:GNAT family N-acetyltransferase [Sporomusa malonica]SMC37845.1 N-acetylglutamate synthase, GNAT family [Sporomusa malonica]